MEKAKCSYCFKERFCLWRYGTTQCFSCALDVISFLLNNLSSDVEALAKVASADAEFLRGAAPAVAWGRWSATPVSPVQRRSSTGG